MKDNKVKTKKEKSITLRARYFFLTIAQAGSLKKETIEKLLKEKEMHLIQYCISLEHHTDVKKGTHFHIWMRFNKVKEFGLKHFDYLGKHGKLEKVKSSANVLQYISKEDAKPLTNFDLAGYNLKKNFEEGVLSLYKQGWSYSKIMLTFPNVVSKRKWISMKKFISEYEEIARETEYRETLKGIRYISREVIETKLSKAEIKLFDSFNGYQDLIDILNQTVALGFNQKHKSCCLSLVGKSNIGKTNLFEQFGKYCPLYRYPEDGWHIGYTNHLYSAIVWQEWEYNLHSPETYLRLFEGISVDLRIKGSKGVKSDRPYIFLTSNMTWKEKVTRRFRNDKRMLEVQLKALKVRIKEIDFESRDLTFIPKLFVAFDQQKS